MEFLIGRTLSNALAALDLRDGACRRCPAAAMRQTTRGSRRPRARRRPRQRRPRPAGGLFPRLDGHARPAVVRLRHPLRVRHVRAGDRQGLPGRVPRPLARRRHALGVPARGHQRAGALRRLGRAPGPRRAGEGRVAAGRRGRGQGLRHGDPRPRHDQGQHAAPVEGRRPGPHRPAPPSTPATTAAPPASRTSTRTSPGCCIRTTARRPAASCG